MKLLSKSWLKDELLSNKTNKKRKSIFKGLRSKRTKERSKNPYLDEFNELKKSIPEWDYFFEEAGDENRGNNYIRLEVLGLPLVEKYAWAVPTESALKIIAHFSPLIELGAGTGYWASLLRSRGVNITAYDRYIHSSHHWTLVGRGGPPILQSLKNQDRTLFLSYPDEDSQLGYRSLVYYQGEYVIHVGELLVTGGGTKTNGLQRPFGKTSSSQFQIKLYEEYHCLLSMTLPCYPYSEDHLSVWKRTKFVPGKEQYFNNNNNNNNHNNNDNDNNNHTEDEEAEGEKEEEEQLDEWASIPRDEMLQPRDYRVCDKLKFLFD